MKSLILLPGVQQGNEGNSGIFVRGGSPDQNLILLDDVPLYNTSHLFGFVSVFTPEALQSVDFYKGAFPARFGGRLSSIVDVRMKDGNKYAYKTDLTLGLLSSKIVHEGPIKKGKSSYLISARRTLLDLLVTGVSKAAQKGNNEATNSGYGFYDINAKLNFELNSTNHLNFSFYTGGDKLFIDYREGYETFTQGKFQQNNDVSLNWGNTMAVGRWNSQINPKLFINTTAHWSRFMYHISGDFYTRMVTKEKDDENTFAMKYDSHVESFGVKTDWDYYWKENTPLQFGSFLYYHNYLPGIQTIGRNGKINIYSSNQTSGWEYGLYADTKFPVSDNNTLHTGLRSLVYSADGKSFFLLEPRLSFMVRLDENTTWSAAYTRMSQSIHLLTNSNIGLPSDIWVPTTSRINPEKSDQFSLGMNRIFSNGIRLNAEMYYKTMKQVVTYSQGYGLMDMNENWEDYIEVGKGRAWGFETEVKYNFSKFETWLGYTLAWNERKFENINSGEWYPHKFDRRHKLDIGFLYKLNGLWTCSANWTCQSGVPGSFSGLDYPGYPGNIDYGWHDVFTNIELKNTDRIQYYPSINQNRLPAYHRLDISFTKEWKTGKLRKELSFSLYNAYSRQNPYFVYAKTYTSGRTVYKQVSLMPVLPSVSYRIRF
ncbi:MAG: TonB-dependent receptor plug domain-containing protein [Prolixibacteraceae bacterium]|nr:TonB-dependent receptor plug domain-containing protein [Prolixibacteraceae bacterium]